MLHPGHLDKHQPCYSNLQVGAQVWLRVRSAQDLKFPCVLQAKFGLHFCFSHRSRRSAASVHLLHGNINDVHHQSLLPLSSPTHDEEDHTDKKKEAIYI